MRAVNLIPADQRSGGSVGAGRSGGAAYAVLGVLAGIALMALLYGIAHHQVNSRQKEAATLSAKAQQAQAEVQRLAPYTSFVAMRQQRVAAVEELVNSRFDWAHTFHEFARVLPKDASINSLAGTVGSESGAPSTPSKAASSSSASSSSSAAAGAAHPGAASSAVTSATPAGSVPTFTVQGCATSQTIVAKTIDRLRLIDGVAGVTLQSSTAAGGSSSGSAGGSAGGCGPHRPAYQLQVTFQPLPSSVELNNAAKSTTVAQTGSGAQK